MEENDFEKLCASIGIEFWQMLFGLVNIPSSAQPNQLYTARKVSNLSKTHYAHAKNRLIHLNSSSTKPNYILIQINY